MWEVVIVVLLVLVVGIMVSGLVDGVSGDD
jgi:hypothetical protein